MTIKPVPTFRVLKAMVARRRDSVLAFMPQFVPHHSAAIVRDMLKPGTMAHALMLSICMAIADELAFEDYKSRAQADAGNDWAGG